MTPTDNDPIGPIGPMGSRSPRRRRKKPSGGLQAITMIVAWVGGAAAAVAVAFWILQYVKPAPDPELQVVEDQPRVSEIDNQNKKLSPRIIKRRAQLQQRANQVQTEKPSIDLENFQRPEKPGLSYCYFKSESFGMLDFANASPSRTGLLDDLDGLPAAKDANGLQLEGFWQTKTTQPCDFLLDSTNDARLYIDDYLVLDNTDQLKREPVKTSRTIEPGRHDVRVEFVLSPEGGNYKLEVGGIGDPNRWDLAQLLQPFESAKPKSLEGLQFEVARYPAAVLAAKSLMASNRKAVESGLVEVGSATPVSDSENAKSVLLDDGQLLVGLAISPQDGRVAAVKPIFLNVSGLSLGETIGQKSGRWEWVIAKPGYAVSEVQIGKFDSADDVLLQFMKIDDKSLLSADAYTQSLGSDATPIAVSDNCRPVVGLQVHTASDASLLGIDALRVSEGPSRLLTILVDGFPKPAGHKAAPSSSEVKKGMAKLTRESSAILAGKKGETLKMELLALAASTADDARTGISDDARFFGLLEARRLYLLGGDLRSAFAINDELSQEFEYDYWQDLLLFFSDATKLAGKDRAMQRQVIAQLDPAIIKAEEHFQFTVARKLAGGGKMLATSLKDQSSFTRYGQQMEEFETNADLTKQARLAARTLVTRPDEPKANRVMGIFSLVVAQESDEAMKFLARSSNKDCEFIAKYDGSFDDTDAEIAMKLADCWRQVGKKNSAAEKLAIERAKEVLVRAKQKAQGKDLKAIESKLERL